MGKVWKKIILFENKILRITSKALHDKELGYRQRQKIMIFTKWRVSKITYFVNRQSIQWFKYVVRRLDIANMKTAEIKAQLGRDREDTLRGNGTSKAKPG